VKLIDLKVKEFLDELSSSSPAPGGGSVSALAGANGCSLIMMVANLTVGKKKFKALPDQIQNQYNQSIEVFKKAKVKFIEYIDLDTESFNDLMAAYKLPKETDEEASLRNTEIEKATIGCIKIPLKVSTLALKVLREVESLIEYSNRNTISDQGVSVLMLYSAIEGAAMNVLINLPGLEDEGLKKEFKQTIDEILFEAEELKDRLIEEVKYLLK